MHRVPNSEREEGFLKKVSAKFFFISMWRRHRLPEPRLPQPSVERGRAGGQDAGRGAEGAKGGEGGRAATATATAATTTK